MVAWGRRGKGEMLFFKGVRLREEEAGMARYTLKPCCQQPSSA